MGKLYQKRKEKLTKLTHFLAAFILLIHGYEKIEEHPKSASLFILCGLIFLGVAVFHARLHKKIRSVDAIFALLEGIAALTLAAEYWQNKHYIQYIYVFVALIYITRSVLLFVNSPKHQHAI